MDIEQAVNQVASDGRYRLLKQFTGLGEFVNPPVDSIGTFKACFLDTETTSLDPQSAKIIDLAFRIVEFAPDGMMYKVHPPYQHFNDPGEPLSEDVIAVTGYTNEILAGHEIDWSEVYELVKDCALVVAYNSSYDRPILERYCPVFAELNWGCAQVDVDWFKLFGTKGKLEWLAYKVGGIFYGAHQALIDVDVMVHLLSLNQPESDTPIFAQILEKARQKQFRIRAVGAPFDFKDELKASGYKWEDVPGKPKAWCKSVSEEELEAETTFLSSGGCFSPVILNLTPKERYSGRV